MVRGYIEESFGEKYLPKAAVCSTAAKRTHRKRTKRFVLLTWPLLSEQLKDMEADAQSLYQLIWRQFVACQMTPAQYDSTTLTVKAGDYSPERAKAVRCVLTAGRK